MTHTDDHNQNAGTNPAIDRTLHRINRALLLAALILLGYLLAVYVVYAVNLIQFPFDYDQGEGFELYDVVLFGQFQWPYADIETFPFYGSIYPPLYHLFLVPFYWLFGAEYWYGRLFSFVSTLITAYLIGYAVYRETVRGAPQAAGRLTLWVAVLAGLAYLGSNIVYHIGPLFRQHISMVMFETAAIVVLAHVNEMADDKRRRRVLLAGFALLLCAGYTKQLAAFTAISALVFLFIRNPRRAVMWGAGFALVGGGIFLFLTIATGGHWWTQTITANVKDFNFGQAEGLLRTFVRTHFWLLLPAALMVVYEIYFDRLSIYSVWFVAVLGLNAFSAGTWGAGDSYYATAVAAMSVLSGIFAARSLNATWRFAPNYLSNGLIAPLRRLTPIIGRALLIVVPLLYIGYGRGVFHMPTSGAVFGQIADVFGIEDNTGYNFHDPDGYITLAYAQIGHLLTDADRAGGERIVERIREIPDDVPVLSEEAGFSFAAGRQIITNPVVLKILDEVGAYDSGELVAMIEAQAFGLIILRAQFYPVAVNQAITAFYEEDERVTMNGFSYIIMVPRAEPLR
ncbi:MAG: hypothetical protein EA396_04700 [Anaerolineaceae bacterium]|nr:MAG: hypothetical protein EA396_04700 [Anaerolineaceae bacterium]